MPWKSKVLVVANVTAPSDELVATLIAKAAVGEASFTLIVPASPAGNGLQEAQQALDRALERFRQAELRVGGKIGDADPVVAVTDAWDPTLYNEIVVSTLAVGSSKWLEDGMLERIGKLTGARVTHVVSTPPKPPLVADTPPPAQVSPPQEPGNPIAALLPVTGRIGDK